MKSQSNDSNDSEEPIEPQGCLAAILRLFGIRLRPPEDTPADELLPYRLTQRFLSAAELSFYKVALQVLPDGFVITAKPRIGDLLFVPRGKKNWRAFENKVRSKHVDFLVCDAQTMTPRLVIELDDSSHDRTDRQDRDEFVNQAFAAAGLEVLHIRVRSSYVPAEVRSAIQEKLSSIPVAPAASQSNDHPPECPNCRIPMVPRTASKGPQKGNKFWGCPNYPNCRTTIELGGKTAQ